MQKQDIAIIAVSATLVLFGIGVIILSHRHAGLGKSSRTVVFQCLTAGDFSVGTQGDDNHRVGNDVKFRLLGGQFVGIGVGKTLGVVRNPCFKLGLAGIVGKIAECDFEVAVVGIVGWLFHNTVTNLNNRGITSGFAFLDRGAGFGIVQHLIDYQQGDTYGRVFIVGLLNTLLVSALCIVFASVLGFFIGLARLSDNWLLRKLSTIYIEIFRNIPPLLQIFFWYFAVLRNLPGPRQAVSAFDLAFLSNRGLYIPSPQLGDGFIAFILAVVMAIVLSVGLFRFNKTYQIKTGQLRRTWPIAAVLIIGLPFFHVMWSTGDVMVTVINLTNDLVCVPIFLVTSTIYRIRMNNKRHKELGDGQEEKFSFKIIFIIIKNIVLNPIMFGNILGFIWAGAGWKFCPFIQDFADCMADGVLGLCLLNVGGFLSQYSIIACPWIQFICCVLIKHFSMSIISGLFCAALNLNHTLCRQTMLMTALPSATASFLLSYNNRTGPGVSTTMLLFSTILCVPAMIMWLSILDALNIFPE